MKKFAALLTLLATMLACGLFAAPAQAQRDRVFVASYGSDSNPCTFGSPCKTFQHAHDAVVADGEITAIDSAGFGPLTITKGITITSPNGVEAGIAAAPGGNAITINANDNDQIFLQGLTLQGSLTANYGISFGNGAALYINNVVIEKFTQDGIYFAPQHFGSLLISNTQSLRNTGNGINIQSPGTVIANFDHFTSNGNGELAINIRIDNPVPPRSGVSINDSTLANNAAGGIACPEDSTEIYAFDVVIRNSTIANNGGPGVAMFYCATSVGSSTISNNSPNWTGTQDESVGNNQVGVGIGIDNSSPLLPAPTQ